MTTTQSTETLVLDSNSLEGRILVFAAEDIVRRTIAEMLEDADCDCESVDEYESALESVCNDPRISTLIVDCVEPNLGLGWFVEQVRELRPDIVIIGSADDDDPQSMSSIGIERTLPKFWEVDQLLEAVEC
ncbi:MAG: hypothetical protein N2C14_06070 [Planctomycetales bacterium]